jgi:hypothetical protein
MTLAIQGHTMISKGQQSPYQADEAMTHSAQETWLLEQAAQDLESLESSIQRHLLNPSLNHLPCL